jgi:L-iditol 2-dehydrogenase
MDHPQASSRGRYLLRAGEFQNKTVSLPKPGPGEVQIAPRSTTLCGSDLHYYSHGRNGSITIKEPLCLGHEFAGEVLAVGDDVHGLQAGDKVAVECGVPCSNCDLCHKAKYNLCPSLRFRGSGSAFPHFQGSMQERINHPAKWTHK